MLAEVDRPRPSHPPSKLRKVEPIGGQTQLGEGVRQVLTEPEERSSFGDPAPGVTGRRPKGSAWRRPLSLPPARGCRSIPSGWATPSRARDLELTELLVDEVVFVDDLVRFQAKLLIPRASRGRR